jgi:hypothetical protein
MIFGINICTFVRNNINLPEIFLGMCCEPVCTSPVSPRLLCSPANHVNECNICKFVIGHNIAMGGACCVDCQCRHIGLHLCNHLIGSKFAGFSANVNSVNFNNNLYFAILGIVRHFGLNKFYVLQPVIASWCVDNFDVFYTIYDSFKFDVNNYLNYFLHLLYDCEYYNDFDTLCLDSLNETAAMFHISYATQDFTVASVDAVKTYLSCVCSHACSNTAVFNKTISCFSVNLQLINNNFLQPISAQFVCNDVGGTLPHCG